MLSLHQAIQLLIAHVGPDGRSIIDVVPSSSRTLAFRRVSIADPNGEIAVAEFDADIGQGERVLIEGDTGAALKLFKVVAGMWPWGKGRVDLPDASIFFATQRPYLPIGPLRDAVSYPATIPPLDDLSLRSVLERVGLAHWGAQLDRSENWEQILAPDEQQRLGFARLLLHRPDWIFIEEATDALEANGEAAMMGLLEKELPHATVITIGHHPGLAVYHSRRLALVRRDGFAVLETRG